MFVLVIMFNEQIQSKWSKFIKKQTKSAFYNLIVIQNKSLIKKKLLVNIILVMRLDLLFVVFNFCK